MQMNCVVYGQVLNTCGQSVERYLSSTVSHIVCTLAGVHWAGLECVAGVGEGLALIGTKVRTGNYSRG